MTRAKRIKTDYLLAAVCGFITAVFLLPTLKNIRIEIAYFKFLAPILVPVLWLVVLKITIFLRRWIPFLYQFAKFAIVGFLNTAIDFGVLNILSILIGVTKGFLIGGVNVPGFFLAATNSYFWNKFWVFSGKREEGERVDYSDFFTFLAVVIIGILINGGIVIFLTTYLSPFFDLLAGQWLNAAKAFATIVSMIWNFVGFKFLVFNKSKGARILEKAQTNQH
jgi:putative flippase GtrA